jgi:glycosyltransferase involved in cell wall biosynthesis
MHVVQVIDQAVPAVTYGGTERVVWWLTRQLSDLGHRVTLLAPQGSTCPFADVRIHDPGASLDRQIPADADVVHLHDDRSPPVDTPSLRTLHGNLRAAGSLHENTVFISADHARRHGGSVFVHNGLDLDEYGQPDWQSPRDRLLFLAKAAWKVKNVRDAITIARRAGLPLAVAGGHRLNIKMGFRLTLDPNAHFLGMVDHEQKRKLLNTSLALLFPVKWHEPFGLALIESLYYGNPVFGTPFGSLPEIVIPEVGFLSRSRGELVRALSDLERFDRHRCHQYVCDNFSSALMARRYLELYAIVCNGRTLHEQRPSRPVPAEPRYLELED